MPTPVADAGPFVAYAREPLSRTAVDAGPGAWFGSPREGQVGSGASQGIEADTQWVMGSVWSLLWRWRGGWAKVA